VFTQAKLKLTHFMCCALTRSPGTTDRVSQGALVAEPSVSAHRHAGHGDPRNASLDCARLWMCTR